jgi:hypothetical protein
MPLFKVTRKEIAHLRFKFRDRVAAGYSPPNLSLSKIDPRGVAQ